ncbi:MAG: winged helix-turn-helix domain-containing protein [Anaerolineales bacterium]|nr:winged helix-turn-helix domain-containing protein [Anaerolineales bacterium]
MNAFVALADPTRLRIFELIAQGEKSVGEIVSRFSFKAPTISQHLKVLKQANLVQVRAEGQKRYYAVNQVELEHMQAWLNKMRKQWNTHLDALEQVLKDEKQKAKGKR